MRLVLQPVNGLRLPSRVVRLPDDAPVGDRRPVLGHGHNDLARDAAARLIYAWEPVVVVRVLPLRPDLNRLVGVALVRACEVDPAPGRRNIVDRDHEGDAGLRDRRELHDQLLVGQRVFDRPAVELDRIDHRVFAVKFDPPRLTAHDLQGQVGPANHGPGLEVEADGQLHMLHVNDAVTREVRLVPGQREWRRGQGRFTRPVAPDIAGFIPRPGTSAHAQSHFHSRIHMTLERNLKIVRLAWDRTVGPPGRGSFQLSARADDNV